MICHYDEKVIIALMVKCLPFPEKNTSKDDPEVTTLLVIEETAEVEGLKKLDDRDVSRVEGTSKY